MRKVLFNKKGITLAELVACVVVLGLVLTLVSQVIFETNRNFEVVDNQWTIQEEIKYIMDSLLRDSASGSLSTANFVDLLHEDMDAAKSNKTFASCPELGTFTEDDDGTLTFTNANTECIYLFNYNDLFYVLNRGETVSKPFMLFESVSVIAEFSVATNALPLDSDSNELTTNHYEEEGGINVVDRHYVPDCLSVTIKSTDDYLPAKYDMQSSYSLKNMTQGQRINIKDGYFTSEYVAGWNADISPAAEPYYNNPELRKASNYPYINSAANIVRYTSASAYFGQVEAGSGEVATQAQCASRFLMMNQQFSTPVIDNLHNFRDDVLKGNVFGEFIIEKYYDFSPAVIELAQENEFIEESLRWFVVHFAMLLE